MDSLAKPQALDSTKGRARVDSTPSAGVERLPPPAGAATSVGPASTDAAAAARPQSAQEAFSKMDADLIRVLEDLVFVLIEKGVIRLEELPPHAQAKLLERRSFRERIQGLMNAGGEIIDALDDSRFGLLR